MRWTEKPADLPLQPLSALAARAPGVLDRAVTEEGLLVIVSSEVRTTVIEHLRGSPNEQGGLLLGEVFTDDAEVSPSASRAVLLRQAVIALDFESSGIALRMETGVWERARSMLGELELIVGWYHSHPGLGAFFSRTDRRTQAAFFRQSYSVGWVIDPVREEEAFFVGRESTPPGGLRWLTPAGAPGGALSM